MLAGGLQVDAVVTGIAVEQTTGLPLGELIRRRHRDLPILVLTAAPAAPFGLNHPLIALTPSPPRIDAVDRPLQQLIAPAHAARRLRARIDTPNDGGRADQHPADPDPGDTRIDR